MLANAVFYGQESESPRVGVRIGPFFRISWFTIWTSLICGIVIIPVSLVIAFMFKQSQPSQLAMVVDPDFVPIVHEKQFKLPKIFMIIAWISKHYFTLDQAYFNFTNF